MTLQDTLASYVRARMARALRPFLRFAVATPSNDNRPRAYTGPYPIVAHRSLAEVWGIGPDGGAA